MSQSTVLSVCRDADRTGVTGYQFVDVSVTDDSAHRQEKTVRQTRRLTHGHRFRTDPSGTNLHFLHITYTDAV